ncbi:MAG: lysophospholipid acyltransferase family protein [Planctomycetota bacterium]|nr:lysophospholipid acyltransferase family protein [Planctomycetota bacterium]
MTRYGLKPHRVESLIMAPTALNFLLLVLGALGAVLAWLLLRPGKYSPWERILYGPIYLMARYLWGAEIFRNEPTTGKWNPSRLLIADTPDLLNPEASDRPPYFGTRKHRGAVLVANHRASVDPCFIQLAAGDRVHWMVAGEYFKVPLVGQLLRFFQCIPTNRGGIDTASTKRAIALAKQGRFVGMFPEGRINRTEQDWIAVRPGAALVALRSRVPLIPIWIQGARMGASVISPLFMPTSVKVFLGAPDIWGLEQLELHDGRSDRQIADQWIQRVLNDCVQNACGRSKSIELAGSNWLNAPDSPNDAPDAPLDATH